jgi:hypothetical protein
MDQWDYVIDVRGQHPVRFCVVLSSFKPMMFMVAGQLLCVAHVSYCSCLMSVTVRSSRQLLFMPHVSYCA